MRTLLAELKRRKVLRVAGGYLVAGWGLAVGSAELLPPLGAPEWIVTAIVGAILLGFPVVVTIAWFFDLTAAGFVRDRGPASPVAFAPLSHTTVGFSQDRILLTWQDTSGEVQRSFARTVQIGRDLANEVCIVHPAVSRQHAKVSRDGNRWFIQDLDSQNGTYIEARRLIKFDPQALDPDTTVHLSLEGPKVRIQCPDSRVDMRTTRAVIGSSAEERQG